MGTPVDTLGGALGLSIGNSLLGGITGGASASKEYEYARRLQKHDQNFQREMRATQYQTTVEDMQKAGINPAVALSGGASTSSQGGSSSASAPNVNYGGIDLASILGAVNQTALTQAQKENIEADTELKNEMTGKTKAEADMTKAQKDINKAIAEAEIKLKSAQTKAEKAQVALILTQQAKDVYYTLYISKYGHAPDASTIDKVGNKIEKFISKSTKNDEINIDGAKLNSMINEWLKD